MPILIFTPVYLFMRHPLLHDVKKAVKISSIFVAFLENMNFIPNDGVKCRPATNEPC